LFSISGQVFGKNEIIFNKTHYCEDELPIITYTGYWTSEGPTIIAKWEGGKLEIEREKEFEKDSVELEFLTLPSLWKGYLDQRNIKSLFLHFSVGYQIDVQGRGRFEGINSFLKLFSFRIVLICIFCFFFQTIINILKY